MKPIIIIKETNKDGKFELTEKELKELIEKAYEQGVEDGKQYYNWFITSPAIIPTPRNPEPSYPHDIYGNPVPYCGTTSDPRDNQITLTPLTTKLNDLVYRPSTARCAEKGEPIPCKSNRISSKSNPEIKLMG